ncbi:hypothetical protein LPAF129_14400 [Ligilactobacillus pabuli]|uniref:Uncharacterized protein n=1 Tax=Ligilactobacillus pabuli TaxID=2886039 RepID=A0ABQ5JI97_9LACO|nr:hypothetical protein [Ligilactobacillus pabuli]GKS81754.1 hypothetical protein LPAF129_14400 [Ligilactobacillus pabuli]
MNLKNDYVECPVNPKRYHSQAMRTLFSVMNSEDIKENDGKYIFDLDFVRKIYKLEPATYKKLIKEFGLRGIKVHTQKNNKIFIRVSEPPYHIISANEKSKKFENIIFPNSIQMTLNGLDVQDDTFFDGIIIEQFSELFPFDYNFDDLKRSFTSHGFEVSEVTTTAKRKIIKHDVRLSMLISDETIISLLKKNGVFFLSQLKVGNLNRIFKHSLNTPAREKFIKQVVCDYYTQGYEVVPKDAYDFCKADIQENVIETKKTETEKVSSSDDKKDGYISVLFKNEASFPLLKKAKIDLLSELNNFKIHQFFDELSFHGKARISFDTQVNFLYVTGYDVITAEFNQKCLNDKTIELKKMKQISLESTNEHKRTVDQKVSSEVAELKHQSEDVYLPGLISESGLVTLLKQNDFLYLSQVNPHSLDDLFQKPGFILMRQENVKKIICECFEKGNSLVTQETYDYCRNVQDQLNVNEEKPQETAESEVQEHHNDITATTDFISDKDDTEKNLSRENMLKIKIKKTILESGLGTREDIKLTKLISDARTTTLLRFYRITKLSQVSISSLNKLFSNSLCGYDNEQLIKQTVRACYEAGSKLISRATYEFCGGTSLVANLVGQAKEKAAIVKKENKDSNKKLVVSNSQQMTRENNNQTPELDSGEVNNKDGNFKEQSSVIEDSREKVSRVLSSNSETKQSSKNLNADVARYAADGSNSASKNGDDSEKNSLPGLGSSVQSTERTFSTKISKDVVLVSIMFSSPSTSALLKRNGVNYLSQLTKSNLTRIFELSECYPYREKMIKEIVCDYYEKGYTVVSQEDYEFCGGTALTDSYFEKNENTKNSNSFLKDNVSEKISDLVFDQKKHVEDVLLSSIMLTSQDTNAMLKHNGIEYLSQLTKQNLIKVFELAECSLSREEIIKEVVRDYYEEGLDLITREAYELCGGFTSETNNTDQNDDEETIVKDQDKNKSIVDNSSDVKIVPSVKDNISSKNNDKMEIFKVDKNKIQKIVRQEYKLTKPIPMTDLITDRTALELLKLKGIEDLTKVTKERLGYVFNDPFCSSDVERQIKETIRACYEAGSAWISMQTYEFCGGKSIDTEQKVVKEQESHKDVANVDIKIDPIVNDKNVTDQDESQNQQKPVEERKNNSESIDFVNVVQNEVKTQVSEKKAEKKTPEDVSLAKLMSKSPSTNAVLRRNGIKYLSQLTQKKLIKLFKLPEFYPYRQRAIKEIVIEYYQKGSSFVSEEAYEFCKYGNVTTHKNNAKMNEVKAKMEEVDKGPRISEIIQKSPTTVELLGQNGIVYFSQLATGKLARIFNMPECHLYQRQLIEKAVCSCYEKNSKWISREVYEFCGGTRTKQKDIRTVGMVDNFLSEKDKVAEIKQPHQEAKKMDEETEQKNIFIHRELKDDDPTILKVLGSKIDDVFAEANAIWISEIDQEALYHVLSSPGLGDKDKNRIQNKLIELYEDGYENISQEVYEACKRVSKGSLIDSNSNEPAKVTTIVEQNSDDPEIFKVFSDQEIINAFARVNVVWLSDISGFNLNRLLTDPSLSPEKKQLIQKTISDLYDQGYRKVNWKVYQICQADLGFDKNVAVEPVRTLTNKDSISKPEPQQIRRRSNLAPELVEFLNEQTEEQNKLHAGYFFVEPIYRKIMTRADLFDKLPSTTYLQKRDLFTSLLKDGADQYYLRGDYPILYVDQNPSLETIISDHFEDKKITNKNLTEFAKDIGFDDGKKLIKKLANNAAFFEFRPGEFVSTHSLQLSMSELEQVKDYLASFVNQDGYAVMGQIIINPNKLPELKNRMDWSPKLLAFYVDQIPEYKNLNWEYIYATSKAVTQNNYIMCSINKPWRNLLDLVQYEVKTNYHDSLTRDKVGRFLDRKHIYTDNNNKLPDYIVKNVFDVDRDHVLHLKDVI